MDTFPVFSELRDVLLVCVHVTVNFPVAAAGAALALAACSCAGVIPASYRMRSAPTALATGITSPSFFTPTGKMT